MRIAVLGAGSWGTTLAILLANKSHDVSLWAYQSEEAERIRATRENAAYLPGIKLPESIRVMASLCATVEGAALVVAAVPSQYLRGVLTQVKDCMPRGVHVVNVAKGIEVGSLLTMSEVIRDVLPSIGQEQICTLSGPSHAEEVSRNIPTTVVAASISKETAHLVQAAFMVPAFRVYASQDVKGVELGGSLKNVIAIASGIIEGLSLGDNTRAALMTRGIAEITRMGVALGSDPRTFGGLSGIGDLYESPQSQPARRGPDRAREDPQGNSRRNGDGRRGRGNDEIGVGVGAENGCGGPHHHRGAPHPVRRERSPQGDLRPDDTRSEG